MKTLPIRKALSYWVVWVVSVLCLTAVLTNDVAAKGKFQIKGKITDWRGENLTNMTVMVFQYTIFGEWVSLTNQTDPTGQFLFETAPSWYIADIEFRPDELISSGYRAIPLRTDTFTRSNDVASFVALSDRPTAHLRGFLTNTLGLPGESIFVSPPGSRGSFVSVSPDGSFDVPVYGGTWLLMAESFRGEPQLLLPSIRRLVIDGVDQNEMAVVARTPTVRIRGDVFDMGVPISNGFVFASTYSNGVSYTQTAQTDSSGNFELPVFEGDWEVSAELPSENFTLTYLPFQLVSVADVDQTVHFGQPETDNFHGRIVDNFGIGISNVQVFAITATSPYANAQSVSDSEGKFGLPLRPGVWSLSVEGPDGLLRPDGKSLLIQEGVVPEELTIVLERTNAILQGTILDDALNPIAYASVAGSAVANESVYRAGAFTDEEGKFCIPLFQGKWRLATDDSYALTAFIRTEGYTLIEAPATSTQLVIRASKQATRVKGTVLDSSGAPITNAFILAYSPEKATSAHAETDLAGDFELVLDFGGEWVISTYWIGSPNGRNLLVRNLSISIVEGIDQNGIVILAIAATAQITGSLKTEDGRPLAGIGLAASESLSNWSFVSSATTDSEGKFAIPALDGDWLVSVDDWYLNIEGYQSPPAAQLLVSRTNAVVNFVAHRIEGDGRIPRLTTASSTNGLIKLRLTSQTDSAYEIEASTDLLNWTRMTNGYSANGSLEFIDPQSTNLTARFYRARWVPGF